MAVEVYIAEVQSPKARLVLLRPPLGPMPDSTHFLIPPPLQAHWRQRRYREEGTCSGSGTEHSGGFQEDRKHDSLPEQIRHMLQEEVV